LTFRAIFDIMVVGIQILYRYIYQGIGNILSETEASL
jgi:hypothetical protein